MAEDKTIGEKVTELRDELTAIRESVNKILDSGMKEKTVLILMKHYTGIPQNKIKTILDGLHDLELEYFGADE